MAEFSITRFWGVALKEILQLRRDRLTFGLVMGLPIAQLILFGLAINADPKNLPTAIVDPAPTEFTRSLAAALNNTGYFRVTRLLEDENEARESLKGGPELFVITIPAGFTGDLVRGRRPEILVQADGADPGVSGQALSALGQLPHLALNRDLTGPLSPLAPGGPPFEINLHRLYNPEGLTRYTIIPSLIGVILTITMVMMTSLAITRETERGTMENMLSMPLRPLEVLAGKIVPYIFIGFIQVTLILLAARLAFRVPAAGGLWAVYLAAMLYVTTNLAVGITISSLAKNQLQAVQMTIMYFMPNLLLSGFMYSVLGEPPWARVLSEMLPLTHFNRLIRGIFLKDASFADLWPSLWPIVVFTIVVMAAAERTYKKTLD